MCVCVCVCVCVRGVGRCVHIFGWEDMCMYVYMCGEERCGVGRGEEGGREVSDGREEERCVGGRGREMMELLIVPKFKTIPAL